jgi:secreted PhoX family phosphatase
MIKAGRRALLRGASAAAMLGPPWPSAAQVTTLDLPPAVMPVKLDDSLAPGYRRELLLRWGDRVTFDAPPWNPQQPSLAAAATQFGWDGRIAAIFAPPPAADGVPRAVLAVTHPGVDPAMVFPDGQDRPEVAALMQGASLLNLERHGERWVVVDGGFQSRRLSAETLCRISGPVAGAMGRAAQGLLGLSGGCATPWGTLLLTEGDPAAWTTRLATAMPRFTEARRFGWVAELDPLDPGSVPVKRTSLGRFAHGDAAAALTPDGRAVVYLTDQRPRGYLFRFTSLGPATAPDALDAGTLSVARAEADAISWRPLPEREEVFADPIPAAVAVGGSALDLPASLALDTQRSRLLLACRGAHASAGQVLEILPDAGDHGAARATARVLFQAGPPARGGRYGHGMPADTLFPEHPATLAIDGRGRLWIGTDRAGEVRDAPDALFGCDLEGPGRGVPLPLYGAPRAASIGGATETPDGSTLLVVVRQPGVEPGASFAHPGTRWPEFDPARPPRSALVAIQRIAGGPVGG